MIKRISQKQVPQKNDLIRNIGALVELASVGDHDTIIQMIKKIVPEYNGKPLSKIQKRNEKKVVIVPIDDKAQAAQVV